MKISIRWVFDHIDARWDSIDIPSLVTTFNEKTAEIEQVESIALSTDSLFILKVEQVQSEDIIGHCFELQKKIPMPMRTDICLGSYYLIKKDENNYSWATLHDVASDKDGLFPAFTCDDGLAINWKQQIECSDVIIHVDNKSITHRPDLWGHRGFAREIAALLHMPFKDESSFFMHMPVQESATEIHATQENPFSIAIKDTQLCNRFAGLYISHITNKQSSLWMALRLARVDVKPIDCIVDITNYVMCDMSQPLHAFDADTLTAKNIQAQRALNGQKMTLLDGRTIDLTEHDLVISDGNEPVALAGIMGGKKCAVHMNTQRVFLEAAQFDATAIRTTALRHKIRTEASARFEKTLDKSQNVLGIMRFMQMLVNESVSYTAASTIMSLGLVQKPLIITITHAYIEERIGTQISQSFVIDTLSNIGFEVKTVDTTYEVTVPSFRASKDIRIKEDIVEEIARFYGYDSLPDCLPSKETKAHSLEQVYRLRSIKQICAYSMVMREVYNYAFFDESLLLQLNWQPTDAVAVKNPVSENYRRLVTTLIPGLMKSLQVNNMLESMRFFEWGRSWVQSDTMSEQSTLAGILFDKKEIDFYAAKAALEQLFTFLEMRVEWQKIDNPEYPWWMPYQTAQLLVNDVVIGTAGKMNPSFLHQIVEGDAFCFELKGDDLLSYIRPQLRYESPSKYPAIERDMSMLIPLRLTVRHIILAIKSVDPRISGIQLIDMFEKQEWVDQRSLTFRFVIQAQDRTLTKDDAEEIWQKVATTVRALGVTVR